MCFGRYLYHFGESIGTLLDTFKYFWTLSDTFGKKLFSEAEDTYDIDDFEGVFNL